MTLRKTNIDNSVRYISKNEQTKRDIKAGMIIQSLENKIKIFQKTIKNSLKIWQHKDSVSLE